MFSKRLARQLKKAFGDDVDSIIAQGAAQSSCQPFFDALPELLRQIDITYAQLEEKTALAARSLEISSQELAENNSHLFALNQNFSALLNSLEQGFIMIDREGRCSQIFSSACQQLLECHPAGKSVAEVLKVPDHRRASFQSWIELLFLERPSFEDLVEIGPKYFEHSQGKKIELQFKPVRDKDNLISALVLIATDVTERKKAQLEAAKMFEYANLVSRVLREKTHFSRFMKFAEETIQELDYISSSIDFTVDDLLRVKHMLHTFKGSAGSFGFSSVAELIHEMETNIVAKNDLASSQSYIREGTQSISEAYHKIIATHAELFEGLAFNADTIREVSLGQLKEFAYDLESRGLGDLAKRFNHLFVGVPAEKVFKRFEGDLRESCLIEGKPVPSFHVSSENVSLVPEELESVLNQLIHIFRNIAVHGIETAEERVKLGKAMTPRVFIDVSVAESDARKWLTISIGDDGRGLDLNAIRAKMVKCGRGEEVANMSVTELQNCIFDHGFSTASELTEIAGRGVGLSSLKSAIEELGGSISVTSEWGIGCQFGITVPLHGLTHLQTAKGTAA